MNKHKYILIALFLSITQFVNAKPIDFAGDQISITGSFYQLAVQGSNEVGIVSIVDLLNNKSLISSINHEIKNNVLHISIHGNERIKIIVPKSINVIIKPTEIVFAGEYIHNNDAHYIHIYDTSGEVEINADGYKVFIAQTSGNIAIVTYEDIHAILPNLNSSSIVSLDSYFGDIIARVPHTTRPRLKITAPKGTINIKGDISLFNNKTNDGNRLILHSESGEQIFVSSLEHLPDGPLNPEYRDQLIKIWIEDQGKNRMDNESRKELTAMGYGPFIESQDEIYKGHQMSIKHRKQFDKLVDQYGFPSEKMVGFQYALGATRQILIQSQPEYFSKYKLQATTLFGESIVKLYERMH